MLFPHREVMHGIAARCREEDMTKKRNFKRRVGERQARTGESHVTARRRLLAGRAANARVTAGESATPADPAAADSATSPDLAADPSEAADPPAGGEGAGERTAVGGDAGARTPEGGPENDESAARAVRLEDIDGGVTVLELLDVTADAKRLGFRCPIALFPEVLEQCELASVLIGLRTALVGAAGDPATARMFGVAFGVASEANAPAPLLLVDHKRPGELARTLQTLYGGVVVFRVAGSEAPVDIMCRPWSRGQMLVLRRLGDLSGEIRSNASSAPSALGAGPTLSLDVSGAPPALGARATLNLALPGAGPEGIPPRSPYEAAIEEAFMRALASADHLFVVHAGRRHRIKRPRFVIGRDRRAADLVIKDDLVSRKHAAVVYRGDAYYLEDLSSANGVTYGGMRIDEKRIDEGDVFHIGAYELRFTYRAA